MRSLVIDSLNMIWIAMVICAASAIKHPDCLDPTRGQRTFEVCGWKFHRAVTNIDIELHGNNSCISCYSNACFQPNAERCRTECPKYWSLCLNYTGLDFTKMASGTNPPRATPETANIYLNGENIILIAFAIFLVVGATGFGIYFWKTGGKSTATKEHLPYGRVI